MLFLLWLALSLQSKRHYTFLYMKIRHIIYTVICGVMMLCGCNDDKPRYGAPMSLRIYGVMGQADLDTELKMGLFVSEPVGVDNMSLMVSANGRVVSEKEIRWAFDQSHSSRFFVYAPYNESYTGQDIVAVSVPTDQSTESKLLKGNLMMSVASGSPGDQAVAMRMKHALTAMAVSFDNRTGQNIRSLAVSGFMTSGTLDILTGSLVATGSKNTITPMRSPDDPDSFFFVYLPQDVKPVFAVTLESGKVINITFDNYCYENPDRIILMRNIVLTESAPESNILSLNGVSIVQWKTNGVPQFAEGNRYISLSGLNDVIPDDDGFFGAYLNKVTVTAVDRTSRDIPGLILEDSSCAVHVWAYWDSDLQVGNTITGPVMGYMDKPSDNEFHISDFYTEYATIGKGGSLPCTESTISHAIDNIDKMEYRRVRFSDVVLSESFNNGRAVFVQDSVEFCVVCQNMDKRITKGVKGNLVGFPVRSGSDVIVMVYDKDQFNSFTKDNTENAFTLKSEYGLYDLSQSDTILYGFAGRENALQVSVRRMESGSSMQVTDYGNGRLEYFLVYGCPDSPVVGHEYSVAFNVVGKTGENGTTMLMECIQVKDGTAWLVDRSGTQGLIFAL